MTDPNTLHSPTDPALLELARLHAEVTAGAVHPDAVPATLALLRLALLVAAATADDALRIEACRKAREISAVCRATMKLEQLRLVGPTRH